LGDRVLVHVETDSAYPLREAVVTILDSGRVAHDVGVRLVANGVATGDIRWPQRLHVHADPLAASDRCWRCRADDEQAALLAHGG
jgi:hypothetical protein